MLLKILTPIGLLFQKPVFLTEDLRKRRFSRFKLSQFFDFFPFHVPHFFDEGCFSSSRASRSLNKQRRSFTPSLLKQLHLLLLMLSEWRASTDMTLQTHSSSDGSFGKGRGFLFNVWLKSSSSNATELPGVVPGAVDWPWCYLPNR